MAEPLKTGAPAKPGGSPPARSATVPPPPVARPEPPPRPNRGRGQPVRRRGVGFFPLFFALVALSGVASISYSVLVLLGVGLLPSLAAYLAESGSSRSLTLSVGALNFAGIVPFAVQIIAGGRNQVTLSPVLTQPLTWVVIFLASAAGWLLIVVMPVVVRVVMERALEQRAHRLAGMQSRLKEIWGPEVDSSDPGE